MSQTLKDEVKDGIKESAVRIFTKKGFKESTIKEIARDAKVSVGNVYRYYKNKEDLYFAVIQGVYDGVHEIMREVEKNKEYNSIYKERIVSDEIFEPMMNFINLYREEQLAFNMLIKGEKDKHYEETIVLFIDMLRDYFLRFWGSKDTPNRLSFIEASAFTNAIVFAVIDLLNRVEDAELDKQLKDFVKRMVKGYFYAKSNE